MARKQANTDISVPYEQVPIVFDAPIDPPLRALECEYPGLVVVTDASGGTHTRTVVAGKRLDLQIQMVKSGGSIPANYLVGLR